ncbi:hypothetical protein C3K47_01415 [Solitalea longa]|uniref:Lipocalin-like domain-containing protein n=1 Tax=Solitalea longa TaxID=2079460 RepID=A0A2S5A9Y2_9SPHI|nr:hypothetical protein [Solitalea longa]POY39182.1 hypothetical protein C3K47_01415 [Solitalea longa]
MNKIIKLSFLLGIGFCLLPSACVKEGDEDGRYKLLSRTWIETKILTNGQSAVAPGRQHIFFSNLKYRRICAVNENCIPAPDGDWSLLTDSTLQTVFNTEINIYIIRKLDNANLWLEYKSGKNKIQLQMQSR